jgi:hypothetical protein
MVSLTFLVQLLFRLQALKRRQVAIKLQGQAEQEEMLQLVLCKVGILSAFLDLGRLLSLLLRRKA